MTKSSPKDVAASVRARLLQLSRERGADFQRVAPPLLAAATAAPPPTTWRPPHGWT